MRITGKRKMDLEVFSIKFICNEVFRSHTRPGYFYLTKTCTFISEKSMHHLCVSAVIKCFTLLQDLWSVIGDDQQTVKLLQTPVLKGLNNSQW